MKIKPQAAVIFSVLFVLAGVLGSWALGWWQTESGKIPPRLEVSAVPGGTAASGASVMQSPAYDPAGIKGSFTFSDVSSLYALPLEDLADAFQVDRAEAAEFKVKELETIFGKDSEVGTSSVRLFVAWYKALPFERREDSFLPMPAAQILREKAPLTAEQLAYLDGHTYGAGE